MWVLWYRSTAGPQHSRSTQRYVPWRRRPIDGISHSVWHTFAWAACFDCHSHAVRETHARNPSPGQVSIPGAFPIIHGRILIDVKEGPAGLESAETPSYLFLPTQSTQSKELAVAPAGQTAKLCQLQKYPPISASDRASALLPAATVPRPSIGPAVCNATIAPAWGKSRSVQEGSSTSAGERHFVRRLSHPRTVRVSLCPSQSPSQQLLSLARLSTSTSRTTRRHQPLPKTPDLLAGQHGYTATTEQ